ncbi:uncharacterized protein BDW70DRAFT_72545 [Aspergillus foveolatus]|uniref:uncharacterized protein n=1 Tax=Aspergillus foveolatus TaxID=210207 RepID=UPI003CCE4EDC
MHPSRATRSHPQRALALFNQPRVELARANRELALTVAGATTILSTTTVDTQITGCSAGSASETVSATASTGSASKRRAELNHRNNFTIVDISNNRVYAPPPSSKQIACVATAMQ